MVENKTVILIKKIFPAFILFLIFIFAFFIRVYFQYNIVFSGSVKYVADDGPYHMRLLENLLLSGHFPHFLYFDPYLYFPYGSYNGVAPLFDGVIAFFIWIISFGKPTIEIINKVAPFYPAVLGSLMVFVVYFTAKAIWKDKKIALLSSFFMAISWNFLFKSLLGSNDHHVMEVLFSSLAIMFLILALRQRGNTKFSSIKKELKEQKKFWLFILLAGFSLGLYFLAWLGALLFLFIIFVFLMTYYLIKFFQSKNPQENNWILFAGLVIFIIPFLMILPFFRHPDLLHSSLYNFRHLICFAGGIISFLALILISYLSRGKTIKSKIFLISLLPAAGLFIFIISKLVIPSFFNLLIEIIKTFNGAYSPIKNARQLVSEMMPLGFKEFISDYTSLFLFSLISLVIILRDFLKRKDSVYLLIFISTIILLLISGVIYIFGQRRFVIYLSYNFSLLAGFLFGKTLQFGWRALNISSRLEKKSPIRIYFLVGSVFILFNVVFFLLYPFPFNMVYNFPNNLPNIIQPIFLVKSYVQSEDFYESMDWLKNNTPDPGLDYYALYEEPKFNEKTGEISPFIYPKKAYGVLADWGFGYLIIYYSHRPVTATAGHLGIGSYDKNGFKPGEALFFIEDDEKKATEYLDLMKTRYIITNGQYVIPANFAVKVDEIQGDLTGYLAKDEPKNSPSKHDNSMIVRLHLFDGNGAIATRNVDGKELKFGIRPLDHFRLVYESKSIISLQQSDVAALKVFEYVKGATISGRILPDAKVSLSCKVETNQGREFIYEKTADLKDGKFEFIVPYSTFGKDGWLPDQTKFAVFAKPCQLKIGSKEIEIKVSEQDVLEGRTIEVK